MGEEWTLPVMAKVWFSKSVLQHQVLVKNIRRRQQIEEGTSVRHDQCTQQ
ncbi:hypothetical protein J15TS10_49720 [Paenibacillus woosongensis]|uniref:Uncharacterized protein n=1 Tax=Paenibacillus woosongensis TaxID=307580 RepID=A0ABQ4MZ10_9BACL|nr:hypothetical protein J15TS10_49720 [Paenibacillus woosongensis]